MSLKERIDRAVRDADLPDDVGDRLTMWKTAVDNLYSDVEKWLSDFLTNPGVSIGKDTIGVHEERTGDYEIARLDIEIGNETIRFEPKGTYVIGAFGRVDASRLGTGNPILLVLNQTEDGSFAWHVVRRAAKLEISPLTKESFDALLEGFLEDYAPQGWTLR